MGDGTQQQQAGGGGGGSGGGNLSSILYALNQIYDLLASVFQPGVSSTQTDILSATTATTALYTTAKPVKHAILQNIDAANIITIYAQGKGYNANVIIEAAGEGIILNPAPIAGQGGGSMPVGNVDLSAFNFIADGGTPELAVYYEL